ncbi:MAG: TAT-variant-translocated molybdopterin oxidoreductase, partial [Bacteroidota bacterium]|nr:TAT-variant-translocated molybdopterin oxidoreductase [Bacteroidota bacterium]
MLNDKPQYWKGLDELHQDPEFQKQRNNEFAEKLPLNEVIRENELGLTASRRDFLKMMGFGISAATLAACTRTPIKKAIPYLVKPDEIDPGIANFYASTCSGCQARCALVVKTREGRPIKIEGNTESPFNRGGVCAVGQATVLNVYDTGRLDSPRKGDSKASWEDIDKAVTSSLANPGGSIRLLTGTITSPSTHSIIKEFLAKYPGAQHITYDAVSYSALRNAHTPSAIPAYSFDKAAMVVSFGADFLGTWLSPVEFTKQYAAARKAGEGENFLYHVQFESYLSLSGSNADLRVPLKPSQIGQVLVKLHNLIAAGTGGAAGSTPNIELMGNSIQHTATELLKNRGRSIVISGSNDPDHQAIVASINNMLGNYGKTMDITNPSYQRQGDDQAMAELVREMNAGQVGVLLMYDVNPVYTYPQRDIFINGLKKVKVSVSLSDRLDETTLLATYVAPDHHFLESWGDAMPKAGYISVYQPTISNIFNTRQVQDSLLRWTGNSTVYYDYLQKHWQDNYFGKAGGSFGGFNEFWANTLHSGYLVNAGNLTTASTKTNTGVNVGDALAMASKALSQNGVELVLYEKVSIRDGRDSNNPWLQELPDPISKVSWDNYVCVSPKWATEKGLSSEDVIEVSGNGHSVKLPVHIQPGQPYGTLAIAYGYGRNMHETAGKVANGIGGNAFPFNTITTDYIVSYNLKINAGERIGNYPLALTQTHHHVEGRDLVLETTVANYANGVDNLKKRNSGHHKISLWKDYRYPGHHWGMVIDLNACTGCNACVVSCQAENNVPVVGKDEVRRRREMHWIRIDRYFSLPGEKGEKEGLVNGITKEEHFEQADNYDRVKVNFQPMLCQHCDNAPCETVCPVNAINHSSEGLNQQVYNRCVG